MEKVLTEDLLFQIYSIVEEIPEGKVLTYGKIASLIGREHNARLIGKALSISAYYGVFPCHRVVNYKGNLAEGFKEQKKLLEKEGIILNDKNCVDLKKYEWKIE